MLSLIVSLIILSLFIADIFFVEFENYGWTTVSMLVTAGLIYWCKLWNIPHWVATNGSLCVIFVLTYLTSGVVWSFVKWVLYLIRHRDIFLEIKDDFVKAQNALIESQWKYVQDVNLTWESGEPINKEGLPFLNIHNNLINRYCDSNKENRKLYNDYIGCKNQYSTFYQPKATENKSRIIAWICYWPFSLVGTFINDPIRRLVTFIFNILKASYQKISDRIFKDFPKV